MLNSSYQVSKHYATFYIYLDCPSDFCPTNSTLLDSDVGPETVSCGQGTSKIFKKAFGEATSQILIV